MPAAQCVCIPWPQHTIRLYVVASTCNGSKQTGQSSHSGGGCRASETVEEEEREELRRGIETRLRIVCEMLNNDLKHHYTNSTNRNSAGSHNSGHSSGHSSSSGVHSLPLPTTQLRVVEVAEMTRLLTTPIPQKILNTNPTAHLPDALKCWSVSSNHFLCSSGFVEDSV